MASPKSISQSRTASAVATPATAVKSAAVARKAPAKAKPAVKPQGVTETPATKVTKANPKKAAAKAVPKPAAKQPSAGRVKQPSVVPAEQRRNYIEMAAYYIAERRGFVPGNPLEDWVQAEAEIDRLLSEGKLGG